MNEVACSRPFSDLLLDFPLTRRRIHVLSARLECSAAGVEAFKETLSEDERERAAKFRLDVHRRRFIVGRGTLRQALSRYLGVAAHEIQFAYGSNGKPSLPNSAFEFNVSHSEELAVFAFAWNTPLGIDVEHIRPINDLEAIAQRFFSRAEWTAIEGLAPSERIDAFFRGWTRKESYIKATGNGLAYPLHQFEVSVTGPARLIGIEGNLAADAAAWCMYDIAPAPGYCGALALRGSTFEIHGAYSEHIDP